MFSAGVRAFLVAMLIALPALMLPGVSPDTTQMIALLSLLAALLTFVEYYSDYPSFIEFRDAPPFNRLRFAALFITIAISPSWMPAVADVNVDDPLKTSLHRAAAVLG